MIAATMADKALCVNRRVSQVATVPNIDNRTDVKQDEWDTRRPRCMPHRVANRSTTNTAVNMVDAL